MSLAAAIALAAANPVSTLPWSDSEGLAEYIMASRLAVCEELFPADFVLRRACIVDQAKGWTRWYDALMRNTEPGPVRQAILDCVDRFEHNGYANFLLSGYCAEEQERAARSLGY